MSKLAWHLRLTRTAVFTRKCSPQYAKIKQHNYWIQESNKVINKIQYADTVSVNPILKYTYSNNQRTQTFHKTHRISNPPIKNMCSQKIRQTIYDIYKLFTICRGFEVPLHFNEIN